MKFVIVGGGTAGWISAAFIKKEHNDSEVVVIESDKIPIIGAGEGSTGSFPWLLQMKGWESNGKSINEIDFLKKTKGLLKHGIKFVNWKGDGSYIYSPVNSTPTHKAPIDSVFFASILKNNRSDISSIHTRIMEDGYTVWGKDKTNNLMTGASYGYHFDGVEVGKFFKEWCLKKDVKLINSEVNELNFDENEFLKSVKLSNEQIVDSDIWIDCTGLSRILVSKTKNKWISYKKNLITNSAIPFTDNITSRVVRMETLSETMNSGWMWKIPLQHRYGCGYVTCDEFQSFDKSVEELEKKLKQPIQPIKNIKFEAGRYEKIWYKNIISNGLASHFLEPLQASSIHLSIMTITNLLLFYLKTEESILSVDNINRFNKMMATTIDDYRDLIQLHYLAGREDTPFWKFVKNELEITDKNKEILEISKHRCLQWFDFETVHGTPGWAVYSHILDMVGVFDKKRIEEELNRYGVLNDGLEWLTKQKNDYTRLKTYLLSAEEFYKWIKI